MPSSRTIRLILLLLLIFTRLSGQPSVKAEFTNNSRSDTYKIEICRNKDDTLIADAFELAAGKSISTLTLLGSSGVRQCGLHGHNYGLS